MAITIDLTGQVDGTFTIEDDGTPGNGTSIVRRPNGTILQTFVHPADSLTFISRAGQSIVVNITDSLTTSNFTIGSLTVPASNPDNISVGSLLTSGIVTLGARGAISEFGSDSASDIIAGRLFMDAGSGIGAGNAIEMQVGTLEAESVTGGINLSNTGALVIGGGALGTVNLRGLFTGTSGSITLVNQGAITLSDDDGLETVHSAGNLTLSAIGSTSDISSNVNQDALFALGNIFLNAGRDILFGRTGANFDNDVRSGGGIFVTAGRDFAIDGFSDMAADDQGQATGGGVTITAGRDILIDDANGTDAGIAVSPSLGTGAITLTTGVGGTLLLHANSAAAIQGRLGGVTIRADRMLIESDSGINVSGGGTVTLTTASAGREILVGSATDGITALELADGELDRVVTASLTIGGSEAGTLSVVDVITHSNNNLTLRSGADVLVNASITTPVSLTLVAAENVTQAAASTITSGLLIADVDTPDFDPAGGVATLLGTVAVAGTRFFSGNNDGDTLNGTPGADDLTGGGGNDTIVGGAGNDNMSGGLGNDTFFVDAAGDVINEAVGQGFDKVAASASYILTGGAEVELLSTTDNSGTANLFLVGNGFDQTIIGNAGANFIDGVGGSDSLQGLAGDDTYIVDSNDVVVEQIGGGLDNVASRTTYVLAAGVEIEVLSTSNHAGTASINLFGNEFGQTIIGNAGSNYLDGFTGTDRLQGLGGDDTMIVDADDIIIEAAGGGFDTVAARTSYSLNAGAEVELLSTTDSAGTLALNLTGNEFAQMIFGNAGGNILNGGQGSDGMFGLGGNDIFAFSSALGPSNVDSIFDFQSGADKIGLDDAIFTGLAVGALPASAFVLGTAAGDADDRIIYDAPNGAIYFDPDGNGAAAKILFAFVPIATPLGAGDFFVS